MAVDDHQDPHSSNGFNESHRDPRIPIRNTSSITAIKNRRQEDVAEWPDSGFQCLRPENRFWIAADEPNPRAESNPITSDRLL
nr:hypothetical protein [Sphingomonas sp. CDS-1]